MSIGARDTVDLSHPYLLHPTRRSGRSAVWRPLALADDLAQRPDEASKRTAISRAYYCALNRARALVELMETPVPDEGRSHDVIWKTLEEAGKGRRKLGTDGRRLRQFRRKADYDPEMAQVDRTAEAALALAHSFVKLLNAELGSFAPERRPGA